MGMSVLAGNLSTIVGASGGGGSCGPSFSGYTAITYDGNIGYIKGMNAKCNADYSGSHACTYDEIIKLGSSYPYSETVWIVDGSYSTMGGSGGGQGAQFVKGGGGAYDTTSYFNAPMCAGWGSSNSSYYGPRISTNGSIGLYGCNQFAKIPCCKN